jgi:demethylmenaquinone methyltransferase / 2-methoxy-6-polyprenyl-1,4-benzoquinol methylase
MIAPHPTLERYYAADAQKRSFVRQLFDHSAGDYDRIERMMAFGTGSAYRGRALRRAGLCAGMTALDVATGTGLVARQAIEITGNPRRLLGVDLSAGMLAQARKQFPLRAALATAEQLPLPNDHFDFLSMGYALRHLTDLTTTFKEFHRVLKPGAAVCILEISRPRGVLKLALLRLYMKRIVPALTRLATGRADSQLLWQYYWDTIESCVAPEVVMDAMKLAGFNDMKRHVELGIFSEYTARK